jgi:3-phenylpropionate/trans-cinnamate dioxygenase ferredoxin subunit
MSEYVEVAKATDIQNGEMKSVSIKNQKILIARADNQFYAASNACPHMGGNLAAGTLQGTVVTCPRHGSQFDLKDGHTVRWTTWSGGKLAISKLFRSPRPIQTYPTKIEGDRVLVEIE